MKIKQVHWDKAYTEHLTQEAAFVFIDLANRAIEIALAEANAQQETYLTADEARKLGAGNAMYLLDGIWIPCDGVHYHDNFKYRAIQPQPQAQPEPADPHATLRAEYSKQVKEGTTELYLWRRRDAGMVNFAPLGVPPAFFHFHEYECTLKPTCQVQFKPAKVVLWDSLPFGFTVTDGVMCLADGYKMEGSK